MAYAAAELHLLASDDRRSSLDGTESLSSSFLGGGGHRATWTFLEARSAEVARLIIATSGQSSSFGGIALPSPSSLSNPFSLVAAMASSLAGAALSLASPSAAQAMAGRTALPRAMMDSALELLQSFVGIGARTNALAASDECPWR